MTAQLRVLRPGPRTTVQDLGRHGWGHIGVPTAGAVDQLRHRAANAQVGNRPDTATLEVTLGGLVVEAEASLRVAVVGVQPRVKVNGVDVAFDRALRLNAGDLLEIATPAIGLYTYLSVAGGIDVEPVLGSRSTDTLSGIGPCVVEAGDVLQVGSEPEAEPARVTELATRPGDAVPVLPGPHLDRVGRHAYEALVGGSWSVAPASDRTAARLDGEPIAADVGDLQSEGLFPGAVQLPPDGLPIVFLANHPATGGYPVVAVVPFRHIGTVAQTRPGGAVHVSPADNF